jgi:predicted component of viral defense system (DUF524 family)
VKVAAIKRVSWFLFRENEKSNWHFIGTPPSAGESRKIWIENSDLNDRSLFLVPDEFSDSDGLIISESHDNGYFLHVKVIGKSASHHEIDYSKLTSEDDDLRRCTTIPADVFEETLEPSKLIELSKGIPGLTFEASTSDPTFFLIKKHGLPTDSALYLGATSYVDKADFQWPSTQDEWKEVPTPNGEMVYVFSPALTGPELRITLDSSSFLSSLRLLENTKYSWALLSGTAGKPISEAKPHEKLSNLTWGSLNHKIGHEGNSIGTFNFKNFLGSAVIRLDGETYVQVESTSLKIGYEDEYLRMLKDLTEEALDQIVDNASITSAHLKAGSPANKENAFGKYILLKAALPLNRLKSSCAIIKSKTHTNLISSHKWLPASAANGRYAMQDPISRIRWANSESGYPGNRRLKPAEVLEDKRLESVDTPPNQFTRFALRQFKDACEAIHKKASRYGEVHAADAKAYAEECGRLLRLSPFKECSDIRTIPFESQVLQKRPGYRELFRAWITSNLGLSIKELSSQGLLSPEAENRDAPKLYELWLISHLKKALKEISKDNKMIREELPYEDEGQVKIFKSTSDPLCIVRSRNNLLISLYYNRSFKAKGKAGSHNPSYSVELKPDYTIEILQPERVGETPVTDLESYIKLRDASSPSRRPETAGNTSYIHFDAKFRINNVRDLSEDDPTKAKPADIYKMHTYNEAIYGTVTSIILYPGKAPKEKKGEEDAQYKKFTDLVPGVSALAVRPDKDATGNACSESAINTLKERLLNIIDLIGSEVEDGHTEESKGHGDYLRMRDAETIALQPGKPDGKTFKYRRPPTRPVDNI